MPDSFLIQGGKPLNGEIEVRGAKNAVFPLLAAALLTEDECIIRNVPLIEDVFRMIEILKSIGAEVSFLEKRTLRIRAAHIDSSRIDADLVTQLRGSVLFLGPLLARFGKIEKMPRPGGCVIGARSIDTHVDAFSQLGAQIAFDGDAYDVEVSLGEKESAATLNEFSVTATANALIFAAGRAGRTVLRGADTDYQVQELVGFLRKMGASVEFLPERTFVVEGKRQLSGVDHELMADPIEAGTFILTAAAARGKVAVHNTEVRFLELFLKRLRDFGVPLEIQEREQGKATVMVSPWKKLRMDRVQCLPHPGIHSDLLSAIGVLATRAEGVTLLHDPLYEGRLKYLEELNRMGARIIFCDPHRAMVEGPVFLRGRVLKTADLRGGAALVIAGLIAEGETVVQNVYQIDRGYEKLEERLRGIGADIKRIKAQ